MQVKIEGPSRVERAAWMVFTAVGSFAAGAILAVLVYIVAGSWRLSAALDQIGRFP